MATNTDSDKDIDNPLAVVQKPLRRLQFFALIGILMCIALLASSVAVVVYSGVKSMSAFEDLPKFRVNTLVLDYRAAVNELDTSMQDTEAKLSGHQAQFTLRRARELSGQLIESERVFNDLLGEYAQAMALAAEQTGGALEWNRHFQADIGRLRQRSELRQQTLQAVYAEFPPPMLDESDAGIVAPSP